MENRMENIVRAVLKLIILVAAFHEGVDGYNNRTYRTHAHMLQRQVYCQAEFNDGANLLVC